MRPDLLGTSRAQLPDLLETIGVPSTHARGVFHALHQRREPLAGVRSLGRHASHILEHTWFAHPQITARYDDPDGTIRLVLTLEDGASIESVLIPMPGGRTSLCVSTQAGCAMACAFCATGTLGLKRSLRAGEIVAQVHLAQNIAHDLGKRIQRVVYMGMGEPLHALDATLASLDVLADPALFARNHLTVSTVGLPGPLKRFLAHTEGQIPLALSLHAGTDDVRAQIVPISRRTSLADLREILLDGHLTSPIRLAYTLLPGLNDTPEQAEGVGHFARGLQANLNVLPYNPVEGLPFRSPNPTEVTAFAELLRAQGLHVTVRRPRGRDVAGACGQLALRSPPTRFVSNPTTSVHDPLG